MNRTEQGASEESEDPDPDLYVQFKYLYRKFNAIS